MDGELGGTSASKPFHWAPAPRRLLALHRFSLASRISMCVWWIQGAGEVWFDSRCLHTYCGKVDPAGRSHPRDTAKWCSKSVSEFFRDFQSFSESVFRVFQRFSRDKNNKKIGFQSFSEFFRVFQNLFSEFFRDSENEFSEFAKPVFRMCKVRAIPIFLSFLWGSWL